MSYTQLSNVAIEARPRARNSDPHTSHVAAARSKNFASSHSGRILSALKDYGSMTAQGIAGMTGLEVVQIARRCTEMQRAELIEVVQQDGADLVWDGFRVWAAL